MHFVRSLSEAELLAMSQASGDWVVQNPFKGRRPQMYAPKSAAQETSDANLRTCKTILQTSVELADKNLEWQCRYQTRRIGLVSRLDPGYDRASALRPKFQIVAGIEDRSAKAFVEKGVLTVITGKTWSDVEFLTLEQEINAAIR